jgi:PAS domain S-box-containing protein
MVSLSSDAAFGIDDELRVCAWNDRAGKLLGYSSNEVLGRSCGDVIRAFRTRDVPLCVPNCEIGLCLGQHQPSAVGRCYVRHKQGRFVPVEISSTIVAAKRQARGEPGGLAIIFLHASRARNGATVNGRCLRVRTFGQFSVAYGNQVLDTEKWQRKHALTLLKCLTTHCGRAVPRERLMDWLWPEVDETVGAGRLKVVAYCLRKHLREAGIKAEVLETVGAGYALKREAIWVDRDAFEAQVTQGLSLERQGRPSEAIGCLEAAMALYRGDYLEDAPYAEWCIEERERLREMYLQALGRMANLLASRGEHEKAVHVCRTALATESCRESIHRALMRSLVRLGSTDQAAAQFHRCRTVLSRELGVEPTAETQRVFREILGANGAGWR